MPPQEKNHGRRTSRERWTGLARLPDTGYKTLGGLSREEILRSLAGLDQRHMDDARTLSSARPAGTGSPTQYTWGRGCPPDDAGREIVAGDTVQGVERLWGATSQAPKPYCAS